MWIPVLLLITITIQNLLEMFKLVAVCALLAIAFSFDLGELDEGTYGSLLREQGFSEEDIQQFVEVSFFLL